MRNKALLTLLTFALFSSSLFAQRHGGKKNTRQDQAPDQKDSLTLHQQDSTSKPVVTHHSVTVHGVTIHYTATTGYLPMKNDKGKVIANIFFIAYAKDGTDPSTRPVTFAFNGGPGSSSIWLHMGALGPRRVVLDDKGTAPAPPYHLEDNQNTWLDKTDIVFIDPVSTGYSRTAGDESPSLFHGYTEDIQSVGDFIRLYVTKYERWGSPKFLAGESYGTTRAAGLSGYLQDRYSMYLNGIVLISSVLNFQTISFSPGNDLPYIFFLPTYATTAWYYKKLNPELQNKTVEEVAKEAEDFSGGQYASVLLKGTTATDAEKEEVISKISEFTGLSKDYVRRSNMRIRDSRFFKQLLRDSGKVIGRYDSRFSGEDIDDVGEYPQYDPSDVNLNGVFVATFNNYVRKDLKYQNNINYEPLANVWPWDYKNVQNRFLDVSSTLHTAMVQNPYLRVWVVCGYYDLATPFFNAEYTVDHMGLKPDQQKRMQITYYQAGHMVYISKSTIEKLHDDAVKFYDSVLGR